MLKYIYSKFQKKEKQLEKKKPIYYITMKEYEILDVRQQILLHSRFDILEKTFHVIEDDKPFDTY